MNMIVCKIFFCFSCLYEDLSSLENSHSYILAGTYFIFLKERPKPNFKGFQNQIWTSVKR